MQAKKQSLEIDRGVAVDGELAALRSVLEIYVGRQKVAEELAKDSSDSDERMRYMARADTWESAARVLKGAFGIS